MNSRIILIIWNNRITNHKTILINTNRFMQELSKRKMNPNKFILRRLINNKTNIIKISNKIINRTYIKMSRISINMINKIRCKRIMIILNNRTITKITHNRIIITKNILNNRTITKITHSNKIIIRTIRNNKITIKIMFNLLTIIMINNKII